MTVTSALEAVKGGDDGSAGVRKKLDVLSGGLGPPCWCRAVDASGCWRVGLVLCGLACNVRSRVCDSMLRWAESGDVALRIAMKRDKAFRRVDNGTGE